MSHALILESGVQIFRFNDFSLFGLLVEGGVWQRFVLVKQADVAGSILADSYSGIPHGVSRAFGLDLIDNFFKLNGQVFGKRTVLLPG